MQKVGRMPKSSPSLYQQGLPFGRPIAPVRRPAPQTEAELLLRCRALSGVPVGELAAALAVEMPADPGRAKGFIGQLAEAALGADPTAFDGPDFPDLGIELKTIPLRQDGMPAESTFCCSVTFAAADRERWADSRLRKRLNKVLFLPVQASQVAPMAQRVFMRPLLWRPAAAVLAALQHDWEDLMGRLGSGERPSGHSGELLQLRPKAAHSGVRGLNPIGEKQLPVGLYLRSRFTARILAGEV